MSQSKAYIRDHSPGGSTDQATGSPLGRDRSGTSSGSSGGTSKVEGESDGEEDKKEKKKNARMRSHTAPDKPKQKEKRKKKEEKKEEKPEKREKVNKDKAGAKEEAKKYGPVPLHVEIYGVTSTCAYHNRGRGTVTSKESPPPRAVGGSPARRESPKEIRRRAVTASTTSRSCIAAKSDSCLRAGGSLLLPGENGADMKRRSLMEQSDDRQTRLYDKTLEMSRDLSEQGETLRTESKKVQLEIDNKRLEWAWLEEVPQGETSILGRYHSLSFFLQEKKKLKEEIKALNTELESKRKVRCHTCNNGKGSTALIDLDQERAKLKEKNKKLRKANEAARQQGESSN